MPIYLYRILWPNIPHNECPVIELSHSCDAKIDKDPNTGFPLERVYTIPNLSKGYSAGRTKQLLSDKNIAGHGFTKYVRDPISKCYVKTAGHEGPDTFKA